MNLIETCKNGNIVSVIELVSNCDSSQINKALVKSSKYGHITIVKYLIEYNADVHTGD